MLALDLAEGNLSEGTLALLTSLVMILGGSLIILLVAFLLLMNKEVRKREQIVSIKISANTS